MIVRRRNYKKTFLQDLITRIDGEFRHGMPHGEVTVWYGKDNSGTESESGLKNGVRIEGTFRMGRPHGHARVVDLVIFGAKIEQFCVRNLNLK